MRVIWRLDPRIGGDGALVWWRLVEAFTLNRVIAFAAAGNRMVAHVEWRVAGEMVEEVMQ